MKSVVYSSFLPVGVEIEPRNCQFAQHCIGEFLDQCMPPFAVPEFAQGHILDVDTARNRKYTHIYCGFGITSEVRDHLLELLALGGVMVAPVEDAFQRCTRSLLGEITTTVISSVMFADMLPHQPDVAPFVVGTAGAASLAVLCRG